ncbi:MAG: MarR family transcriptional regulator [Anaeromicrobium sp.]|jgi:DNA-binding MarR family transcriptional regulator|uniref:MarR family winged helix-turn-helix transcriptional regulator n=1 Tax=Anaeromicrobium sp. TaxID=1929132 RepID=UPI0025E46606|nr:MarR family transcriptional regulator [Anaeromicrobium sp.]MCT4592875.1 MarR family transcriptional regulator [Anaeromicrobium sp.]
MKDDILKLDNQLCFALYACSKEIIRLYKPILDEFGITYTQYITLLALWEEDNVIVKDLGSKLLLRSNTLTPVLKKLENMDLIERIRDKNDERNVYIKLTKKGAEMKEKAIIIPQNAFCQTGLDLEELRHLRSHLKKLLENMINL